MPNYVKKYESEPVSYDDVKAILHDISHGEYTKDEIESNNSYKALVVNMLPHTAMQEALLLNNTADVRDALVRDSERFNRYMESTFNLAIGPSQLSDQSLVSTVLTENPLNENLRQSVFDQYRIIVESDINKEVVDVPDSVVFDPSESELEAMFAAYSDEFDAYDHSNNDNSFADDFGMQVESVDYSKAGAQKVKQSLEEIEFLNDVDKKLDYLKEKQTESKPITAIDALPNQSEKQSNITQKDDVFVEQDDELEL